MQKTSNKTWGIRYFVFIIILFAIFCTLASKAHAIFWPEIHPFDYTSPAQDDPWNSEEMPAWINISKEEMPGLPSGPQEYVKSFTLFALTDIALKNNPQTREAWANARAMAANWAKSKNTYYPHFDAEVMGIAGEVPRILWGNSYMQASMSLSYLLLDFGGRKATAESARQSLIAANWNHNQSIQDILRNVPQAYYMHLSANALKRAVDVNLLDANTTLAATVERRKVGVSTLSDVLKARAQRDQVVFDLEQAKGTVSITRGNLATVIGWPANTNFKILENPKALPLKKLAKDVNDLIEISIKERPVLNSAMAKVRQQKAELKKATTTSYPKLTGLGQFQWDAMRNFKEGSYYGGVQLQLPIFHGFEIENSIREARERLSQSRAAYQAQEDAVISEVWNSYYNFKTSKQQLDTSFSVLASSQESFNASLGRYKAGVADITELLNAQAMLAHARAQLVQSRMNLYTSYAELVHAVGIKY